MNDMLDRVAEDANVLISDLHCTYYFRKIGSILERIKDEYSLQEWNEFVRYVRDDYTLLYHNKDEIIDFFKRINLK